MAVGFALGFVGFIGVRVYRVQDFRDLGFIDLRGFCVFIGFMGVWGFEFIECRTCGAKISEFMPEAHL